MGKKRICVLRNVIAIMIALFIVSCSPGKSEKQAKQIEKGPDLKQLLSQAIQGIDNLERENRNLKATLKQPKKGTIASDSQSIREELEKTNLENEALQKEIGILKGQIAHTQLQVESKEEEVNARVEEVQQANQELEKEISKLKGMLSFSRLQLEAKAEEENARIAALEKENQQLTAILNKINSITKEQGAPASSAPAP